MVKILFSPVICLEPIFSIILRPFRAEGPFRGVVEWFIAPVLKTGDRSRGPGVRIPPPLPTVQKVPCAARDFLFSAKPTQTKFEGGRAENKKADPTQAGLDFLIG